MAISNFPEMVTLFMYSHTFNREELQKLPTTVLTESKLMPRKGHISVSPIDASKTNYRCSVDYQPVGLGPFIECFLCFF